MRSARSLNFAPLRSLALPLRLFFLHPPRQSGVFEQLFLLGVIGVVNKKFTWKSYVNINIWNMRQSLTQLHYFICGWYYVYLLHRFAVALHQL